jgi:hypothetical protein
MMLLAVPFIPSSFALFVVRERETKAKHLQVGGLLSFSVKPSFWPLTSKRSVSVSP